MPERIPASSRSSHSIPGRSRLAVGSSSSRMSGEGASAACRRGAARASPPDKEAGSSSPEKAEFPCSRYNARWRPSVAAAVKARLRRNQSAVPKPKTNPVPATGIESWRQAGQKKRSLGIRLLYQPGRDAQPGSIYRNRCGRPGRSGHRPLTARGRAGKQRRHHVRLMPCRSNGGGISPKSCARRSRARAARSRGRPAAGSNGPARRNLPDVT